MQLLSEPSGGSDLAGVITRADRKGDKWVINGAKTWSTSAFAADYGLMLARTDWDAPKHEGLTMFMVPINSPGITLRRIKQVNGSVEFCEEFFDNLELGDDAVVGEVNAGWQVASRQLYHERRAVGGGSEFASGIGAEGKSDVPIDYVALLEATGQADSERAQEAGRPCVGASRGARAADRPRLPRRSRRLAAAGRRLDHPGHPRRRPPSGVRHRAVAHRQFRRGGCRRRHDALSASDTSGGRPRHSAAAPPKSHATSSANACWASRASTPPTAACRSIRSSATRAETFPRETAGRSRFGRDSRSHRSFELEEGRLQYLRRRGRRDLSSPKRPAIRSQAVLGDQRSHPVVQRLPVIRWQIRSAPVQLAVHGHQFGMGPRKPCHEPPARRTPQVQPERRHSSRSRRGDLLQQRIEVFR